MTTKITRNFVAIVDEEDQYGLNVVAISDEAFQKGEHVPCDKMVKYCLNAKLVEKQMGQKPIEGMVLKLDIDFMRVTKLEADFRAQLMTNKDDAVIAKVFGPEKPLSSYSNDLI